MFSEFCIQAMISNFLEWQTYRTLFFGGLNFPLRLSTDHELNYRNSMPVCLLFEKFMTRVGMFSDYTYYTEDRFCFDFLSEFFVLAILPLQWSYSLCHVLQSFFCGYYWFPIISTFIRLELGVLGGKE